MEVKLKVKVGLIIYSIQFDSNYQVGDAIDELQELQFQVKSVTKGIKISYINKSNY